MVTEKDEGLALSQHECPRIPATKANWATSADELPLA